MTERIVRMETHRNYFTLQWHLTARCEYSCKHCYMRDSSTYRNEIANELNFETCIQIIDDFHNALKHWGILGRISFTGGDPLLKEGIIDLIKYARNRDIRVGILGNPDKLTEDIAYDLKKVGVFRYQISIDGLEETHDKLRGRKGAFKDALAAIELLNDVGIPSVVMFTVSKANAHELIDVIRLVAEREVSIFDFARLVPIGSGRNLYTQMLKPLEYRTLLLNVLEEYKLLQENGYRTYFGRKDHLWKLLYQELGLLKPLPKDKETIYSGCGMGINLLTILADGSVLPCRRLPIQIGKVPEQKIGEIFINSPKLNDLRKIELMEKCSMCELFQVCRGCPAAAYGITGRWTAPDPQCWKKI